MNYGLDALKTDMPELVRQYFTTGKHPAMSKEEHKIFMNCVELFRTIGIPIEQVEDNVLRQLCLF